MTSSKRPMPNPWLRAGQPPPGAPDSPSAAPVGEAVATEEAQPSEARVLAESGDLAVNPAEEATEGPVAILSAENAASPVGTAASAPPSAAAEHVDEDVRPKRRRKGTKAEEGPQGEFHFWGPSGLKERALMVAVRRKTRKMAGADLRSVMIELLERHLPELERELEQR